MSFEFDNTIRAVYFIAGNKQDWMAAINEAESGTLSITWRFRYYDPEMPLNHPNSGRDKRSWNGVTIEPQQGGLPKALHTVQSMYDALLAASYSPPGGIACKLLRGSMTHEQFLREFDRLPFVYKYTEPVGTQPPGAPWR